MDARPIFKFGWGNEEVTEDFRKEIELLSLQLQQTHEELGYYFSKQKQATNELEELKVKNRELTQHLNEARRELDSRQSRWFVWFYNICERQCSRFKLVYGGAELYSEQVNPDYEHLYVKLTDVSFGTRKFAEWAFRISCAGIKPGEFGEQPKLEIPEQRGQLLKSWFPESESEYGRNLELRFALPNSMDIGVWSQIDVEDQKLLRSLLKQLPEILREIEEKNNLSFRDWGEWHALVKDMQRIHQRKVNK